MQSPISIVSPTFFSGIQSDNVVAHEPTEKVSELTKLFLANETIRGENPAVFKYRVRFDEADEAYAFAAIFYDCFEVYSYSPRELAEEAV